MDMLLHRRMLVLVVGAALALAAAFVLPSNSSAAPEPFDPPPFVVEGECDFDVLVEYSGKVNEIELPGGRVLYTAPGLHAILTNLEEPTNQVTLNITGAVHQTELANGDLVWVFTGRNLLWGPDTDFVLLIGRFTGGMTAAGEFPPITGEGRVVDICALLE